VRVVVVHGGGPQITAHLDRLGVDSEFRGGLRVTTQDTMQVVRMVLVGQVNSDVVSLINKHGPFAVGLSGEDASLLTAERRDAIVDGQPVDIGFVGDVVDVQPAILTALLDEGKVPVVATVARGTDGALYNVNADTAAAAVARLLKAEKLVFLSDVPGIFLDRKDPSTLLSHLRGERVRDLIKTGVIDTGMVPKVEAALEALEAGVGKVHIIDAKIPHSILLEIYSDTGIGTEIVR
jgi:acetylglutamate kinase